MDCLLHVLTATAVLSDLIFPAAVEASLSPNKSRLGVLTALIEKDIYDSRVPPDYEKNVPTNVTLKLHLLSFDSVSETNSIRDKKQHSEEYSVELFLTQNWTDERLIFQPGDTSTKWLEIDTKMMQDVWVPDVYFRNEKQGSFHDVTVPNKFMHLYPEGKIVYSVRLSLTLKCRMHLVKYPLDTQKCPMSIQSYTYTTENVMLFWDKKRPVSIAPDISMDMELPQFSIIRNVTINCRSHAQEHTYGEADPHFACLEVWFFLRRDIRFYIIQVYVPSSLIVALSWVSFWLDIDAIPARVSLGVLTVLTLNTHGSTIQATLPKVSYIKAIDVWVLSSLIFVFAAFLEFAYVNVMARRVDKELAIARSKLQWGEGPVDPPPREKDAAPDPAPAPDFTPPPPAVLSRQKLANVNGTEGTNPDVKKNLSETCAECLPLKMCGIHREEVDPTAISRNRARYVDRLARVLFPLTFAIFNVIYWLLYIYAELGEKLTV